MRFSEQWLRELVNPPLTTKELVAQLVMAGHEVESFGPVAGNFKGVVVGLVKEAQQHPNADRLKLCKVTVGEDAELSIVCGGTNVRTGMKVAVAMIGAQLGEIKIKQTRIRGIESQGMLCSETELGLGDSQGEILDLPAELALGQDVRECLKLEDNFIEVEITPNRGDCLGMLGMAREVSALTNSPLTMLPEKIIPAKITATLPIKIDAPDGCSHYIGRVLRNIKADAVSPLWLTERLRRSGLNSISPVVDVTNYVLMELGQPMHAFDLEKLQGEIQIRYATAGETLTLLNEQSVTLDKNILVIADSTKPLALAGIMGGKESSVTATTQHVFLESAFFNPIVIAGRARRLGFHSDSSYRFERGVDPTLQRRAIERATELLLEIVGGEPGPISEVTTKSYLAKPIHVFLPLLRVGKYLGFTIEPDAIEGILRRLHMQVTRKADGWDVQVPSWRFDISLDVDLIEEVARLYGYHHIPFGKPPTSANFYRPSATAISLHEIRSILLPRGYQEALNYTFVDPKLQQLLEPQQSTLALLNPISAEMAVMRTNLWPGLLTAVLNNQARQQARLRLFEIGPKFLEKNGNIVEQEVIAGIAVGSVYPEQWGINTREVDFFDIKNDIEALLNLTGFAKEFVYKESNHPALHPGQSSNVMLGDQVIGYIGAIHPEIERSIGSMGPVFVFELALETLQKRALPRAKPLSKFPSIRRDIAVVVAKSVPAYEVEQVITTEARDYLVDLWLFDAYEGPGIAVEHKSLAFALILQHPSKTLVDSEVTELMSRIVMSLKNKFQATLRE